MLEGEGPNELPEAAEFGYWCRRLAQEQRPVLKSYLLLKLRRVMNHPPSFHSLRQWKFQGHGSWLEPRVIGRG